MKGKKILLGVTGGIAAYKAAEIIRLLQKNGAEVKVVMTRSAQEFVRPLTFATLAKNRVYTEMFCDVQNYDIEHISLARWADAVLIAPASANIIAKLAHGIADDLLSTLCLAANVSIYVAPAMNHVMWQSSATQANVELLRQRGVLFLGPTMGEEACGEVGMGRMLEPSQLVAYFVTDTKYLLSKKIVITAGPTVEPIDPVRFISNHSSGKMGYALAEAAVDYGAEVLLISGPTNLQPPAGLKFIAVKTAEQMYEQVMQNIVDCDLFIAAAAVADYRVEKISAQKLKRSNIEKMDLCLVRNPDILFAAAHANNPPFTVGFAAETENLLANAEKKLAQKGADIIAANKVGNECGFYAEDNAVTLMAKNGMTLDLGIKRKQALAYDILDFVVKYIESNLKEQSASK